MCASPPSLTVTTIARLGLPPSRLEASSIAYCGHFPPLPRSCWSTVDSSEHGCGVNTTPDLAWAAWWGLLSFSGVAEDSVKGVHGKKAFEALLEGYYYKALHWNSKDVLITRGCLRHWLLACKVVLRTVSVSLGWFVKLLFFKGLFATIFLTICTAPSLGHGAQMLKSFCLLILQPKDLFTFSCRCFPLQCLSSRGKGWRRDGSSQGFCWASHSCSHSLVKAQAQILTVYVLMCQN